MPPDGLQQVQICPERLREATIIGFEVREVSWVGLNVRHVALRLLNRVLPVSALQQHETWFIAKDNGDHRSLTP